MDQITTGSRTNRRETEQFSRSYREGGMTGCSDTLADWIQRQAPAIIHKGEKRKKRPSSLAGGGGRREAGINSEKKLTKASPRGCVEVSCRPGQTIPASKNIIPNLRIKKTLVKVDVKEDNPEGFHKGKLCSLAPCRRAWTEQEAQPCH